MPSPRQRLEKIISNAKPSSVVLNSEFVDDHWYLVVNKQTEFQLEPNDDALQDAVKDFIRQEWYSSRVAYSVDQSPATVFENIKGKLATEYGAISIRCDATKRKTESFIRKVTLDHTHLANFLLQLFISIKSSDYRSKSVDDKRKMFESLESLRRVYGKQL